MFSLLAMLARSQLFHVYVLVGKDRDNKLMCLNQKYGLVFVGIFGSP